jgi:hypothetical protein
MLNTTKIAFFAARRSKWARKMQLYSEGYTANSLRSGSTEFCKGSTNLSCRNNRITMEISQGGKTGTWLPLATPTALATRPASAALW